MVSTALVLPVGGREFAPHRLAVKPRNLQPASLGCSRRAALRWRPDEAHGNQGAPDIRPSGLRTEVVRILGSAVWCLRTHGKALDRVGYSRLER